MRKIIIALLLAMLCISSASAVYWDIGKILSGRQMTPSGAIWVGDDQKMYFGNDKDASIFYNTTSGAAEVVGLTAVNNLSIEMESGEDITFAGGDSLMDLHLASGIFKTPTGAVTIGPGATSLTGATTIANLAAITAGSGSAAYDLSASTGAFSTSQGTNTLNGNVVISGSKTFATGTGAVGINGDVTIAATKGITKTAGAGNIDFSAGTGAFKTTTGAVTVGGATTFGKTVEFAVNATTTISTVLTSTSVKTEYDVDVSGGNVTLTLPDAATVPGRIYFVSTSGNPGNNYVRITATGGDDINANNYLVSTDQWSNAYIIAANGAYRAVTSGTWAAHA